MGRSLAGMNPPEGQHSITPHLVVPDAGEAMEWYAKAFGAVEVSRVVLPGNRVMSLHMEVSGSAVMLASEFPDAGILAPASIGGTASVLQVYVEDVDARWARALEAGAIVRAELHDAFWGDRHGSLVDPFGHRWNLARHDRDVPPEEVAAAAAAYLGGGS